MKLLSRYIFREIISSALLGTVLFTFVLFLQRIGKFFEILVRGATPPGSVAYLMALVLPSALTFTVPLGALVGILIGLSRMSGDGEIIAMRASGVPSRRVLYPVALFSMIAMLVTASATLWLTPWSIRQTYKILNKILAAQLTAEIQPRVFEEQFPNTVLYVGDVIPGTVVHWKKIFLADITPAEQQKPGARDRGEGPVVTIASEAIAVADTPHNRIQLSMTNGSSHEAGKNSNEYYSTAFPRGDEVLQASQPEEVHARAYSEMDTIPLMRVAHESVDARIELHQRLALPPACVLLALLGVALGVSSRKAGKSAAVVMTVFLAFLYYMGLISLIGMARQGKLPAGIAVWMPNMAFAAAALILLIRLESPGDRDVIAAIKGWWARLSKLVRGGFPRPAAASNSGRRVRLPLLPQIIDTYVLTNFILYFTLMLLSFVLMTEVYTFFELLSDVIKNNIAMSRVFTYLFFLTPKLIYDSTPLGVLVAVLVTFGVLTKHNEVTAFKASGVSVYRLVLPVFLASTVLSLSLFAFDYRYVPEANRKQETIRDEIKGRPVQTYLRPDRKWIKGEGSKIYYYKYFDQQQSLMIGVSVYELDPDTFRLRRHISAARARWEAYTHTWIFENGWMRDLKGTRPVSYNAFQTATFAEIGEPPSYFLKEVKQDKQMNFEELAAWIRELQQSGFDTVRLQVQFHKKFSAPLFALVMAVISVPFAFLTGSRGAMAGVGVSLGIAIAYFSINLLFEQIGNLNQLPAAVAAWSPDAVFSLAGMYLLTRLRT
jgi:LPS export ABC transporter permease LptF/LPS export ABC transporter permease LptG